jgi:galactonate dehydratase
VKITKVETIELRRSTSVHWGMVGWLWVRVHTDEGIVGLGETCPASAVEKAVVLNDLAPRMIGRDARDIEAIWHDSLMAVQYRGWAGAEIRAISAVDVALWDLLAKCVNLPVYRLLGGQCWDSIPIYNTCYDDRYDFNTNPVELANELLSAGVSAMKIWPFDEAGKRNHGQSISKAELKASIEPVRKIRDAFGDSMQIAMEFHGYWNLPCAIQIAEALEPYKLMWLEEILPQDNLAVYATLAKKCGQPLCVSERLVTRWGFRELLENGAASVVMFDLAWCGGLSEAKKIANWAETYYLPVTPHNCSGPVSHFANWHFSIATPNFWILETVRRHYGERYVSIATSTGAPTNGRLGLPPGPGLGVELKPEFLNSDRVQIESFPPKP